MRKWLQELSEQQQQDIGRLWLLVLYDENIKVNGVKVEFEARND